MRLAMAHLGLLSEILDMKKILLAFLLAFATPAAAQVITPASTPYKVLYSTGVSVGNGADTTQDTLQTYTLPSGTMANVGDTIHIVVGGRVTASTDSKTATVQFGGQTVASTNVINSAVVSRWSMDVYIIKTGANAQSWFCIVTIQGSANGGTSSGTITVTDTSPITISSTGQNTTTATANSITSQGMIVEYIHQ